MQGLCLYDAMGKVFADQLNDFLNDSDVLADLGLEPPVDGEILGFARELAVESWALRGRIDALLSKTAAHWRLGRMAPVERNVLRLGVYELLETDTAVEVVIDEAIELAKRFGGAESPTFVNGILDAIAREVRGGDAASPGASEAKPTQ
jgi:transcription antitermination factor NusB